MRRLTYLLLAFVLLQVGAFAQKTWDGGGADNNFSTAANWDDDTAPSAGSNEIYIFDATSTKSCNVDVTNIDCDEFLVNSGYTSTINMGTATVNINNLFTINDGTVIATSGTLSMNGVGAFTLGGGVLNNNGGTFEIFTSGGNNFIFSGAAVLNKLNLTPAGGSASSRTIDFGSNLTTNSITLNSTTNRILAFQGTLHIKAALDLGNSSHTTNTLTNNGTFIFDGSSALLIGSSSAGAGKAYLPNIEINTTGTYSISNSINVRGNWTGTQGTLTPATSTVNFHSTSATISGSFAAFDNLTIPTGSTLTFPASAEVKVAKNFTKSGTLSSSMSSTLTMNGGTSAQTITGTNTLTLGSLKTESGARNITLAVPLLILDELKIAASVTLTTGGNLTLNADATSKARVTTIDAGGNVSGNVTVETYVPGSSTGWANWGINGVGGQFVSDWDGQIPMACENCLNGVTSAGGYFESIQGWDDSIDFYDTLITASTALTPGRGFWVYVGSGATSTSDFTLSNSGPLVQGTQTIGINIGTFFGSNLIANPFPCAIDWDAVMLTNASVSSDIDGSYYIWNAEENGGAGGSVQYTPLSGSTPNGYSSVIPAGQGFYVTAIFTGANFIMSIPETDKITSNSPLLKVSQDQTATKLRLKVIGGEGYSDETLIHFNQNTSEGFDRLYDAKKRFSSPSYLGYPGSYSKYTTISTKSQNIDFAINSLPPLTQSRTIPLLVRVASSGTHTITAFGFENFNSCLVLLDKLTNSYHNLLNGPYICNINDTTSVPRFELIVCESGNVFTGIKELNTSSDISIYQDASCAVVQTNFTKATKAFITVYNILGQQVSSEITVNGTETITHIDLDNNQQIWLIKVSTESETVTKKIINR